MAHWTSVLWLFLSLPAFARFEVPGFELVYTAPVETKLDAPDLRNPADVWVEMIASAKKNLMFGQTYAVNRAGEPLERVMEAMDKAGERGVKTRFMVEKKMLRASDPATLERLKKIKGLELRVFEFGKLSTDGIVHAKYFVVDGNEAYVGSQNFDWRSLKHIHETGLRVLDKKIVGQVAAIFEEDWKDAGLLANKKPVPSYKERQGLVQPTLNERAYLVASPATMLPKGMIYSQDELVHLIGQAKQEVRIQVLDYSAAYRDNSYYGVIDVALRAAAARGVKVKLMVSHWNQEKPGIESLKSLSLMPNVEIRIVTIPRAKEGKIPYARVNHSKIMAIDDKIAWIGTSNWKGGYLDRLRNLELVVKDEKLARRIAQLHEQLWSSEYSAKIDPSRNYPMPDKGD